MVKGILSRSIFISLQLVDQERICLSFKVWDVKKGEPLYNFRGHSSRVMCVVWSYLDADLVYSGGEDGTVRPWRPSLQQNRQPPVPGTLRIKTELNARLARRQRAGLFEANTISLTQGQSYSEREYYNGSLRMLNSWCPVCGKFVKWRVK